MDNYSVNLIEQPLLSLLLQKNEEYFYMHQCFEVQAFQNPEAIAAVFEEQQLTYLELNQKADQLAGYLCSLGIGSESRVCLALEPSLDVIISILGIWKAGAIYIPLDPHYPQERLAFIIQDVRPSAVITQLTFMEHFSWGSARCICLDTERKYIEHRDVSPVACSLAPENLAYIIYTSGSTGHPKGVLVSHRGICNLAFAQIQAFHINSESHVLQFASLCFDASISEIVMTLLAGATLYIGIRGALLPGPELINFLQQHAITTATFSPSLLSMLPDAELPALRSLISAGEPCSAEVVNRWGKERAFFNAYGPTETTVCATIERCTPEGGKPSIGYPIANTSVYVLDAHRQLLPAGSVGELYIGGIGIAHGYFNDHELTQERFVPDPFSNIPGAMFYKTGDLGRYLPDGAVEYIGRYDQQVKIRGHRIELGEIEEVLRTHSVVRDAVIIVHDDKYMGKYLVAYILPEREEAFTIQKIRSYMLERVPDYMLPATFILINSLPLTPNGKVDKRALPLPEEHWRDQAGPIVKPRTSTEKKLMSIWIELLGREEISIEDNFFELGGHSLLVSQFVSRVRDHLQIELPLRSLFDTPTIAHLSTMVEPLLLTQNNEQIVHLKSVEPRNQIPLSFAQQRLWFHDQLTPGNSVYHIPIAFHLNGILDGEALQKSFQQIIRRHQMLRTTFCVIQGEACQCIASDRVLSLKIIDLTHYANELMQIEKARQVMQEESEYPFDLTQGSLLRVCLIQLGAEEHILMLTMHHIISDDWSIEVLFQELTEVYNASYRRVPVRLMDLPIQYADFACWQREQLRGERLQKELAYWTHYLQDAPQQLALPTDHPRPATQSFRGARVSFTVSAPLANALKKLSLQEETTLFMTLLAAFQTLLYRYSHQQDFLIGMPAANRTQTQLEPLIGFFVNTLVLRACFSDHQSFRELLRQTRESTLAAYAHQDLPFERLVEELRPNRDLSCNPLIQVVFALQQASIEELMLVGIQSRRMYVENVSTPFDLFFEMTDGSQGLEGCVTFSTDLFDRGTMTRMVHHFQHLLEMIVADPDQTVALLPVVSEKERQQLLVAWNDTTRAYPKNQCVHEVFEEQVRYTPDAIAIIYEDHMWSYRELNTRANQLAHHLQMCGMGPEVLIGICVERSLEMLVGLLGILKAGGGYMPLDSSYPQERLLYMIEDSHVKMLLTQANLLKRFLSYDGPVLCLDANWSTIGQYSKENIVGNTISGNLAYVMYTSGSTGRPKGVIVPHQAINRLVLNTNYIKIEAYDIIAQLSNFSFDASTFEVWGSLLNGAKLVILPPNIPSLEELGEILVRCSITTLWLTAGLFHQMVENQLGKLGQVRRILAGGDVLSVSHVQKALRAGCQITNGYGPTENTTFTSCYMVTLQGDENYSLPIGRPIANTQVYVLDSHLQPVSIGISGELYVGGDGLGRGYLNHPDLTAERFIPHPFSSQPGDRLYKTGDNVRYLPDGNIEFIGRIDSQIKLRGFRIELGEIEYVLRQHPVVQDALVLSLTDATMQKYLVAYVVFNLTTSCAIRDLRTHLQQHLPEYMVPSLFMILERLPLTPNGKVDRQQLPPPSRLRDEESNSFVAPRSETEKILSGIWSQLLQIDHISMNDNFFEMGGHSLLATQAVSRIRDTFLVDISLKSFFELPTVAYLAAHIVQQQVKFADDVLLDRVLAEIESLADE